MWISWRIPKALDKGFQRLPRPRRVPQGNIDWYEKWYELHTLPGVLPTYIKYPLYTYCYAVHSTEEQTCLIQIYYLPFFPSSTKTKSP